MQVPALLAYSLWKIKKNPAQMTDWVAWSESSFQLLQWNKKSWCDGRVRRGWGSIWPQERGRTRGNQAGQVPSTQLSPVRGLLSQGCPSHRGATLKAHRYYFPLCFSVMSYLPEVECLLTSSEVICEVLDGKPESWKRTLLSQPAIHFQHEAGFAIKPLLFLWTLIFPSSKMLFPKLL